MVKNPGILWCGRRVGRGPSEALESAEIGRSVRHASGTPLCETGAADPNAPCGASTAAPVFVDRRLLQMSAFCKLQMIDQSFGVCVFYLRLFFAYFCRYLYVLDVCCQFASCQAMLAICKSYCKIVSEMHQKLCNNPSKIMQNQSKIDQNGAKERSESDLGSKSARGC